MAGNTVVLGFFNDEAAADDAVESLKQWDKQEALGQAGCHRRPRPRRQGKRQGPQARPPEHRQRRGDRPDPRRGRTADAARGRCRRRRSRRVPPQGTGTEGRGPRQYRVATDERARRRRRARFRERGRPRNGQADRARRPARDARGPAGSHGRGRGGGTPGRGSHRGSRRRPDGHRWGRRRLRQRSSPVGRDDLCAAE